MPGNSLCSLLEGWFCDMVADTDAEGSKDAALEYFKNMLEMAGVERENVELLIAEMSKSLPGGEEPGPGSSDTEGVLAALVDALNRFEGISVVDSAAGHANYLPIAQRPEGEWAVTFRVDRSDGGWLALEFLAWFVHENYQRRSVQLRPFSSAPHLNTPGECLAFALEGKGEDPRIVAAFLDEVREAYYLSSSPIIN